MQGDFRIGDRTVVPTLNEIRHGENTVRVQPKAMRVLLHLASRQGEVAGREELIREVWSGTFVTDDVLKRCISDLRRALGDDRQAPRFIQTIPKGGYRLLVPVEPFDPQDGSGLGPAPPLHESTTQKRSDQPERQVAYLSTHRGRVTIVIAIGLMMGAVLALLGVRARSRTQPRDDGGDDGA